MSNLWIVHRDPRTRAALARLAPPGEVRTLGPGDPAVDREPAPRAVLLGVAGDLELELDFCDRLLPRLRQARVVLLCDPGREAEVRRLFDALDAELLPWPPDRRQVRELLAAPGPAARPLSERRRRAALAECFARWFADLDAPGLLRALDPGLAPLPLVLRGERGTGRSLLARYAHAFGAGQPGVLAVLPAAALRDLGDVVHRLAEPCRRAARDGMMVLLEEAGELRPALARDLADLVAFGLPPELPAPARLRFVATAREHDRIEPVLEAALGGLALRIPPLRERTAAIPALAEATADAFRRETGAPRRSFAPDAIAALREYPWPGNLFEFERVIWRTLALAPGEPVTAEMLRFDEELELELGPVGATGEPDSGVPGGATRSRPPPPPEGPARPPEAVPEPAPAAPRNAGGRRTPEPTAKPGAGESAPATGVAKPPAPEPAVARAETASAAGGEEAELRRLAAALAHEIGNPLATLRTFVSLLPERFDDPEFRERFGELVGPALERLSGVAERLGRLSSLPEGELEPVDVIALLREILDAHRATRQRRRLVVLEELEEAMPPVRGDAELLRVALDGLVATALERVPERGDVYVVSRVHPPPPGSGAPATVRLVMHLRGRAGSAAEPPSLPDTEPAVALARLVVRIHGGDLLVDTRRPREMVVVLDLPAAGGAPSAPGGGA